MCSDPASFKPPTEKKGDEIKEVDERVAGTGVAKEQKITPFDVEGGVDAEGKSLGM